MIFVPAIVSGHCFWIFGSGNESRGEVCPLSEEQRRKTVPRKISPLVLKERGRSWGMKGNMNGGLMMNNPKIGSWEGLLTRQDASL